MVLPLLEEGTISLEPEVTLRILLILRFDANVDKDDIWHYSSYLLTRHYIILDQTSYMVLRTNSMPISRVFDAF